MKFKTYSYKFSNFEYYKVTDPNGGINNSVSLYIGNKKIIDADRFCIGLEFFINDVRSHVSIIPLGEYKVVAPFINKFAFFFLLFQLWIKKDLTGFLINIFILWLLYEILSNFFQRLIVTKDSIIFKNF